MPGNKRLTDRLDGDEQTTDGHRPEPAADGSGPGFLVGTTDGVFRAPTLPVEDPEPCLDAGTVHRLKRPPGGDVLAATDDGLYRTSDNGRTWHDCDVPTRRVHAVTESDGQLFAGTLPAAVYRSDDGETWTECRGFQALPVRADWPTDPNQDEVRVHTLASHPAAPERLIAGVEVAGLYASTDYGRTWHEISGPFHDDVHQVVCRTAERWVLAGREGVYRTRDAGDSWTELPLGKRRYVRQLLVSEGRLYVPVARSGPLWDGESGADAALYAVDAWDGDHTRIGYAGAPVEKILSWATAGGRVFAGTTHGTLLEIAGDSAAVVGRVPVAADAPLAYGTTTLCPL
ncbi:glycosyl hydrolase [Haloarcula sp. S1CR25-12]|uniref:Glycosyl hydrolase n=1 Tax=Haloarcula saliterrae TaxID=2950534 RepID=A0ABU2FDH4_9EURY|nr:glycosyl hydrolase [Haloarcula sp. S1CR25-12]MDS0260309.1 glycosyl hydrolase [Haloarcula sp. S1CR25-12]